MKTDINVMTRLWNDHGLSMGEIASRMGISRSMVSGLINRNRDRFEKRRDETGMKPVAKRTTKPREPIVTAAQKANERRKAFQAVNTAAEPEAAPVEPMEPEINAKEYDAGRLPHAKGLTDLKPCDCRWPLTDDGPHLFCCAEVKTLSPYCQHHAKRAKGQGTKSERRAIRDARFATA